MSIGPNIPPQSPSGVFAIDAKALAERVGIGVGRDRGYSKEKQKAKKRDKTKSEARRTQVDTFTSKK